MSDLMSQIRNDEASAIKDSIEASLKAKVSASLDMRKQQVAAQVFNGDDDVEEVADELTEDTDDEKCTG